MNPSDIILRAIGSRCGGVIRGEKAALSLVDPGEEGGEEEGGGGRKREVAAFSNFRGNRASTIGLFGASPSSELLNRSTGAVSGAVL